MHSLVERLHQHISSDAVFALSGHTEMHVECGERILDEGFSGIVHPDELIQAHRFYRSSA